MNANPSNESLLGRFSGEKPPAPAWFHWALQQDVTRSFFEHDGLQIELLTWGQVGRPGLLFLHGDSAHADWWSFVAPFFASEWRCAAISWSGMGRSGWRKGGYEFAHYAAEAIAAIDAAKLDNGGGVTFIAHSLGGYPALIASRLSNRVKRVFTIDSAVLPDELQASAPRPTFRPHRIYATIPEALARFRFLPPSVGENYFIMDHLARNGLAADIDDQGRPGWRWCFDPEIWVDRDISGLSLLPKAAACPLIVMIGENSNLISPAALAYMKSVYPEKTPFIFIPAAGHHVMVDEPLALVAALRASLALLS